MNGLINALSNIKYIFALIVVGTVLFFLLTYLLSIPGKDKIDAIYINEQEKNEFKAKKTRIYRGFLMTLIIILLLLLLITYFFHSSS